MAKTASKPISTKTPAAKAPAKAASAKTPAAPAKAPQKADTKPAKGTSAAALKNGLAKAKAGGSLIAKSLRGVSAMDADSVCREVACEGLATSAGYCRLHYIKNWRKIQRKAVILREGKLIQYIEELVAKYPDKYIEAIRQDLANDKDFAKVIHDLDLDESVDDFDVENEAVESVIDNIKRDFDDDTDAF